jgi:predicted ABC-type transport system involved in lysophospholipase L1 biosynthesis ATPase subunit
VLPRNVGGQRAHGCSGRGIQGIAQRFCVLGGFSRIDLFVPYDGCWKHRSVGDAVTESDKTERILHLSDGISFNAGPDRWGLSRFTASAGEWTAFAPNGPEPVVDPSVSLSRILSTMLEPESGAVELFSQHVYRLDYGVRQRMRAKIGFVHGYGGLLSNRTIAENLALPVSVHGHLSEDEEIDLVQYTLHTFGLEKVSKSRPHEVDGATRWNVCLARALVLRPAWLVLEGIGNWEMDRGQSISWKALMDRRHTSAMATAVCLPRQNPGFETWFEKLGGRIVRYDRVQKPSDRRQ